MILGILRLRIRNVVFTMWQNGSSSLWTDYLPAVCSVWEDESLWMAVNPCSHVINTCSGVNMRNHSFPYNFATWENVLKSLMYYRT